MHDVHLLLMKQKLLDYLNTNFIRERTIGRSRCRLERIVKRGKTDYSPFSADRLSTPFSVLPPGAQFVLSVLFKSDC